jgi:hypothetical protein
MARLLSVANWPEDGKEHPEYPVEFQITLVEDENDPDAAKNVNWAGCCTTCYIQRTPTSDKEILLRRTAKLPRRDLQRLATDLKALLQQSSRDHLTFVPLTPCFELWLNRLSDDQYRVIVWQDLSEDFGGADDIAYQGLRFMTNRARLMGFMRSLESDLAASTAPAAT